MMYSIIIICFKCFNEHTKNVHTRMQVALDRIDIEE